MKQLFEIDLKDYKETDTVFRRPSARAIIIKDDKIALVYSKKEKYYKFPGGGIHDDEDKKEALIREVREEVGLVVIPDSIREYGSVLRRQKSTVKDGEIWINRKTNAGKQIGKSRTNAWQFSVGYIFTYAAFLIASTSGKFG